MFRRLSTALVATALCSTSPARAQTVYSENFESMGSVQAGQFGPQGLVNAGWTFQNRSQGVGTGTWRPDAGGDGFYGQSPTRYLVVEATIATFNGVASGWAILPPIAGAQAGDTLTLYVCAYQYFRHNNYFEVLYSPSGGTSTGSSATSYGDFTTILSRTLPDNWSWQQVLVTLPGSGRLALRYSKPDAANDGLIAVDSISITHQSPEPPYPAPGQTVHWTLAMSPVQIPSNKTIVSGGTVIVDSGVEVVLNGQTTLSVAGSLIAQGTGAQPVRLTALGGTAAITTTGGALDFTDTVIDVQIKGFYVGTGTRDEAVFRRCSFINRGQISSSWNIAVAEDCTYDATYGPSFQKAVRLKNFASTRTISLAEGLYVLDNVSVDGASAATPYNGMGFWVSGGYQPTALTGFSITNSTGPGIYVNAGNVFIDPGNTNAGNAVAVELADGGLMTGSDVPAAGNTFNGYVSFGHFGAVPGASVAPAAGPDAIWGRLSLYSVVWGNAGLPYAGTVGSSGLSGRIILAPGITTLLSPGGYLTTDDSGDLEIRGTPQSPITLTRLDPAQSWLMVQFATAGPVSNTIVEGSDRGLASYLGAIIDAQDCILRDNGYGGLRGVRARKTQFLNNAIGITTSGSTIVSAAPILVHPDAPNAFVGNGIGVENTTSYFFGAEHNWWGSPTGPQSPYNPGGTGDPATAGVTVSPWLTSSPDFSDHLPMVTIRPTGVLEPGSKLNLRWESFDDGTIVSHRIAYATVHNANESGFVTLATVPGNQREYEMTVPDPGYLVAGATTYIRVTATDNAGQEGFHDYALVIPDGGRPGEATIVADVAGRTFAPADIIPMTVTGSGFDAYFDGSYDVYVCLEGDGQRINRAGGRLPGPPYSAIRMPAVSTDSARLAIRVHGSMNLAKWFFTPMFSIRPDARIGDDPPEIALESPLGGESVPAGSVVPVSWTASDDIGLRMFRVVASYDGGRTWHLVQDNIPPSTRTYNWRLAAGSGIPDVRIMVVAVDSRFQNTSQTSAPIAITPGSFCAADFNGDGFVDGIDYDTFNNLFEAGDPSTDINADGFVDGIDYDQFNNAFEAGC